MVPGIALATTGGSPGVAIAGSFLTFGSMAVFRFTVVRHGFGDGLKLRHGAAAFTPAE
ncbi:hypothetical protein [Paracoccus liaowanqingii]|uniref:hypothetical protein n=1 Tax=Paracoccus liaowanqingii TaxID=2560053 RepID=UPI001E38C17F|nr:hypothetical protein [Paracoccus liaowanqingii]